MRSASADAQPASLSIGVDVGGTSTRVVAFGDGGEVLLARTSPTPLGASSLVAHLEREVDAARHAVGSPVASIGVGIPGGVLDGAITFALNLGLDEPLPLAGLLRDRFDVPVVVENDVNAAAFGAAWRVPSIDSLTFLSIGTGIAAGTVLGEVVQRGAIGMAGEIGHVPAPGRIRQCACGQLGCIEALASGRALIARMGEVGLAGDVHDLWTAADAGHVGAVSLRTDAVDAIAWCCQVVVMLLDVEQVVLGGGVGLALGDRLVDDVRVALTRQRTPLTDVYGIAQRVVTAPDDVPLGALGAAQLARRSTVA